MAGASVCWAIGWTMRSSEAAYLLLFLPVYIQKKAKQSPLAQETNPFLRSQGQIQKRHPGLGWGLPLAFITEFKHLKHTHIPASVSGLVGSSRNTNAEVDKSPEQPLDLP